jgi:hypothetical protein
MRKLRELSSLNIIMEPFNNSILDHLVGGNGPLSSHIDPTHGGTDINNVAGSNACACACACWPEEQL